MFVHLRQWRRAQAWILLSPFILTILVALTTYGDARFRYEAEIMLYVLTGVFVESVIGSSGRWSGRPSREFGDRCRRSRALDRASLRMVACVQGVEPGLRAEVEALRWFHRIELAPGLVTPGQDESQTKLQQVRMPERLDGWSVLDIGAWDGFFSFEAEGRGASRVVAVDPECWREPAWGPNGWGTKRPFELARRALGSKVEDIDIDIQDLSPSTVGDFDLVLLLGVFYHLPDPLAVMKAAASVCKQMIIVETHADLLELTRPAMAYYPGEVDGDPSNWWGPNEPLLRALLETDGFSRTEGFTESRARRAGRSMVRRARRQPYRYQWGRLVVHGWR